MRNWSDKYIGIPFEHNGRTYAGCDCWGLVRCVYHDLLGIGLPVLDGALLDNSKESAERVSRIVREETPKWERTDDPQPLDVVLLRVGRNHHVGVVTGLKSMLHIMEGIYATVESYESPLWAKRILGFYRYAR
jgi:cell wall-associated NlpC family hydrolase